MALVKALLCLATGGCVVGVAVGTSYISVPAKDKFLNSLKSSKDCTLAFFLSDQESKFGTVYTCADTFLWYLEKEESFDWTKSFEDLMPLFKKIDSFKFKQEADPHLTFTLNDGQGERKISVDPVISRGEYWRNYGGFSGTD